MKRNHVISGSVGGFILLVLILLLSSCTGSDTDTAAIPEVQVENTTQEFREDSYLAALSDQRRDDRERIGTQANTSSISSGNAARSSVGRTARLEFSESSFMLDLERRQFETRSLALADVAANPVADTEFNYDSFIAKITELRNSQRSSSAAAASSVAQAGSSSSYVSWYARYRASLQSGSSSSVGSFLTRSSSSKSSRSSIPSFLNRTWAQRSSVGGYPKSSSSSSTSSTSSTYNPYNSTAPVADCFDGRDNDGDKMLDAEDPQCHTDGNGDNMQSFDPRRTETTGPQSSAQTSSQSSLTLLGRGSERCSGATLAGFLGYRTTVSSEGFTLPGLINGDCPLSAAVFSWDDGDSAFGSTEF